MENKIIKTSYGEYEVSNNCSTFEAEQEDVFSCQNNCIHCTKMCDVGYTYLNEIMR